MMKIAVCAKNVVLASLYATFIVVAVITCVIIAIPVILILGTYVFISNRFWNLKWWWITRDTRKASRRAHK